jgi:hypothetical protein
MARASQAFGRARALCVELERVTGGQPVQYRMVAPIAQSIGFDAAAAEAAVALAIEHRWLIRTGEPPHSVCLTDEGRNLANINGYRG